VKYKSKNRSKVEPDDPETFLPCLIRETGKQAGIETEQDLQ